MINMLQLAPPIWVETPLGKGVALMVIDYGIHVNSCWVVTLGDSGVIKHFDSNDVTVQKNWTYKFGNGLATEAPRHRDAVEEIKLTPAIIRSSLKAAAKSVKIREIINRRLSKKIS